LLLKRAHAGNVAAPAFDLMSSRRGKGGANHRHPRICVPVFATASPQAVKLRLTLFLQPNHGFGESFHGSGGRHPHDFFHMLRWNRPELNLAKRQFSIFSS
jgi:hypothetical protein